MSKLIRSSVVSGAVVLLGVSASALASERITGAGATFPAQIYQRWFGMLAGNDGPLVNSQALSLIHI